MLGSIGPAAASFSLCLLFIVALRSAAVKLNFVDRPGGRKSHRGKIPLVGGVAMFFGAVLGISLLPVPASAALPFVAAATLLVAVGVLDDRYDLSPVLRLVTQAVATLILMFGAGLAVHTIGDPLAIGALELSRSASLVFTLLITLAAINAFNILDGLDGLAGGVAVVAFAALACLAGIGGMPVTTALSLIFIGSTLAFLIFNLPTALKPGWHCFMGDAGSTLLGLAVAWLCIGATQGSEAVASSVSILWFVAMPLFELIWTMYRRISRGVSPLRADSDHFHHSLMRAGFSHGGTFLLCITLAILLASCGVIAELVDVPDSASFALLIVAGAGVVWLMYHPEALLRFMQSARAASRPGQTTIPTAEANSGRLTA